MADTVKVNVGGSIQDEPRLSRGLVEESAYPIMNCHTADDAVRRRVITISSFNNFVIFEQDNNVCADQMEIQMPISYPIVDFARSFSKAISSFMNGIRHVIFPLTILVIICTA
jgi:hypothetical protein